MYAFWIILSMLFLVLQIIKIIHIPILSDIHIFHYETLDVREIETGKIELISSLISYVDYNKKRYVDFLQKKYSTEKTRVKKLIEIEDGIFAVYSCYFEALKDLFIDDRENLSYMISLLCGNNDRSYFYDCTHDFEKHKKIFNSACRKYKDKNLILIKCMEDDDINFILLTYALQVLYRVIRQDLDLLNMIIAKIRKITIYMKFSNYSLYSRIRKSLDRKFEPRIIVDLYSNEGVFKFINVEIPYSYDIAIHRKYHLVYDYSRLILRIFEISKIDNNQIKRKSFKDIQKVIINKMEDEFKILMEGFKFNDGYIDSIFINCSKIYFIIVEKFSLSHLGKLIKIIYGENEVYVLDSLLSEKIIEMVEFASKTVTKYFQDLSHGTSKRQVRIDVNVEYNKTDLIFENTFTEYDPSTRKKKEQVEYMQGEIKKDTEKASNGYTGFRLTESEDEGNTKVRAQSIKDNDLRLRQKQKLNFCKENILTKTEGSMDIGKCNLETTDRKTDSKVTQKDQIENTAIGNRGLRTIPEEDENP